MSRTLPDRRGHCGLLGYRQEARGDGTAVIAAAPLPNTTALRYSMGGTAMSRRHLDIIIATGGVIFALLVLGLGAVLRNQAIFAADNVTDELTQQKIVFTAADKLTPEEAALPGLTKYAGQPLTTGKQAQAYAGMIGLHLEESAARAGFPGETYASISTPMAQLRTQIADAKAAGDTQAAADAQKKLDAATSLRDTQFRGETLRGMLLTSYGFSILAARTMLASNIFFTIAAVAIILSVAGFVHAFVTPKEKVVLGGLHTPAPTPATE